MDKIFFHVDSISRKQFVRPAPHGTCLVSGLGGTGREWRVIPPLKHPTYPAPQLWKHYSLSPVDLRVWRSTAIFSIQGKELWAIDALHFSGNPKLRVSSEGTGAVRIELSGARFPGTEIPADLEATITPLKGRWLLRLAFAWGGFQAETDLEMWLQGAGEASSTLLGLDEICELGAERRLLLDEQPEASFYPSWGFRIKGGARMEGLGQPLRYPVLFINLLTAGMKGMLLNPSQRRTLLTLGLPTVAPWFSLDLKGVNGSDWRLSNPEISFSSIQIEAAEETNGHVRRLMAAYSLHKDPVTDSFPFLNFEPGADLLQDDGSPFALRLDAPCYLLLHDSRENGFAAALIGTLAKRGAWLHTRRASLQLGPATRPGFLLLRLGTRTMLGHPTLMAAGSFGLRFRLLASATRPGEGLIANPAPVAPESQAILSLGVPEVSAGIKETLVRLDGTPAARILFPADWWSFFLRHTDLLSLMLHYSNLRLSCSGDEPPRLTRSGSAPGTVVVHFPPQSVAEAVTDESDIPTTPPPGPVAAMISGLSRLAFSVHASQLTFDIPTLFDWLRQTALPPATLLEPRLAPAARTPPLAPPVRPAEDETAIEAPFDLQLSPDQTARWEGDRTPLPKNGRSELWHVRLAKQGGGIPTLRGLWTSGGNLLNTPLRGEDREDIIAQTRGDSPIQANRLMLSALGAWLDLDGQWDARLESWRHIATLGRDHYVRVVHRGFLLPYGHRVVYVEISERKFQERLLGYKEARLFKRRFIFVREPLREFPLPDDGTSFPGNDLRRQLPFGRVEIVNRMSPILESPANPECSDRCVILKTSDPERPDAFWPMVRSASGIADVLFHVKATDRDGLTIEFDTPMAFVRGPDTGEDVPVTDRESESAYAVMAGQVLVNSGLGEINTVPDPILDAAAPQPRHIRPLGGQTLVFARRRTGSGDTTSAEVDALAFRVRYEGARFPDHVFTPLLAEARARLPVMRTLGQLSDPVRIAYADQYLKNGFGAGNSGQLFLRLVKGEQLGYGSGNRPDKVGALVSPGMNICGISRTLGPVGSSPSGERVLSADLDALSQGTFDAASYFPDAKLLGFISLKDILGVITGFAADPLPTVPRWVESRDGSGKSYHLKWTTRKLHSCLPFETVGNTELSLDVTASLKSDGKAESRVSASLGPFALTLGGVIRIEFVSLAFEVPPGCKPLVHVELKDPGGVAFDGALGFLEKIQHSLGLDNFVDPPYLDVSSDGITCGYTLGIPSLAVGAFALQNLALSAGANLPFTGDPPRVRFAISERHNPFLITVSLFAGGGFFGIEVGPDGTRLLEVALEFGGNIALNLGVASGGVHVMAGIYFKLEGSKATLSGYVRAGGSLEVLGLITVSVEFYLGLTYESAPTSHVWGEASMTVEIEILFFSASVSLTVRREFAGGSEDIPFDGLMSRNDWDDYLAAFADDEVTK